MSKKQKFNWTIYMKDNFIVGDLNGSCNFMIDTNRTDTLVANKSEKKAEIEYHAQFTQTTVEGIELLN